MILKIYHYYGDYQNSSEIFELWWFLENRVSYALLVHLGFAFDNTTQISQTRKTHTHTNTNTHTHIHTHTHTHSNTLKHSHTHQHLRAQPCFRSDQRNCGDWGLRWVCVLIRRCWAGNYDRLKYLISKLLWMVDVYLVDCHVGMSI